jgi:hypothetical protein
MSKKMASVIAAYGVVLAALGLIIQQTAPALAQVIFTTGMAGGGLCVLWGIVAFAGHKRRVWVVLTLIAVAAVVLHQMVHAWSVSTDATSISLMGRFVLTLMFLMTVGMLMYVFHGERPPEFYDPKAARRDKPSSRGEPAQQPVAARRP